ncbi:MFS transporter [Virgisporangium aliadipatigenens]|uniref:MFS transporter n=1 Tax=Virgisporangium aliadipatigenens TaxID=741659 RepID=A0A8J4DPU4_9ACTN|nr:MFS transporter [Virgisporangium aliadipatigenens]GIJ45281.1 MFS transporter [Virgisporangium aliadipatigenens]
MTIATERGDVLRFVGIWLTSVVSGVGSALTGFVFGVWVYRTTGSVTGFALMMLASVLPSVLVGPFAGVAVDRFDRRRVLVLTDTVAAVSTAAVGLLYLSGDLRVWHLYAAGAVGATCGTFHLTAYQAMTPLLIPKRHLGRANGFMQASWAAQIAAPLVAGTLLATIGMGGVIVVDLVTFAVAVAALLVVRLPAGVLRPERPAEAPTLRGDLSFGLRFLRRHGALLGLVSVLTGFNFAFAAAGMLVQPLILSFTGVATLGVLMFAGGSGLFAGAMTMSAWGGPRRKTFGVAAFTLVGGLAMAAHSLRPSALLIGVLAPAFLFTLPVVNGCANTVLQLKVPTEALGRVLGTAHMLSQGATPIAYLLAAPVAQFVAEPALRPGGALAGSVGRLVGVGPGRGIAAMFLVTGALLVILAAVVAFVPALRRVEVDLPDAGTDADPVRVSPSAEAAGVP